MADRIELLLFAAGFASWTASTLSGGGGSILLLPAAAWLLRAEAVAPVVTLASLMASPARMLLLWRHIAHAAFSVSATILGLRAMSVR